MFVKVQKRERRRSADNLGDLLTFQLVEARRVDGKPRQRVVAYLGAIRSNMATSDIPNHRIGFWLRVEAVLDELELDASERGKIEAKIAERAPYAAPGDEWSMGQIMAYNEANGKFRPLR